MILSVGMVFGSVSLVPATEENATAAGEAELTAGELSGDAAQDPFRDDSLMTAEDGPYAAGMNEVSNEVSEEDTPEPGNAGMEIVYEDETVPEEPEKEEKAEESSGLEEAEGSEEDGEAEEAAEDGEEVIEAEPEEELEQASSPTVSYRTHIQSVGWQGWKKNGQMSGTSGQAKRLEAIQIKVSGVKDLGICYKTHIQSIGWESSWRKDGKTSGTSGKGKRLEAIEIQLTGNAASKYDVWYCVHAQHFGWLDWAKNGAYAGTAGYAYRLEAIEIKVLPKGSKAPARLGSSVSPFYSRDNGPSANMKNTGVAYNTHVQTFGWQDYAYNGAVAGTSGQAKRLEGIHISLVNPKYSGDIQYRTHIQSIGWQGWKKNGQMSGTSGQAKRLEAIQIKLTGVMANHYDIYYRVHAQHFGWMGWAKNGASAGTAGYSYRLEAIQIVLVDKGGARPSTSLGGCRQTTANAFSKYTDPAAELFSKIAGNYFVYKMSGYGGTSMKIQKNGAFSGISQAGMMVQMRCDFSGNFANVSKIDQYTYSVRVTNYSLAHPAGSKGRYGDASVEYFDIGYRNKVFTVYLPGHSVSSLPASVKESLSLRYNYLGSTLNQPALYDGTWGYAFASSL